MIQQEKFDQVVKSPISDEAPCGVDAKYEDEYEELEGEISNLGSPTGAAVSWKKVVPLAEGLLCEKTKDLKVAGYLVFGLFKLDGYAGLAQGFQLLRQLSDEFWECVYPLKPRARASALSWIVDRLDPTIQDLSSLDHATAAHLQSVLDDLTAIWHSSDERLQGETTTLGKLVNSLKTKITVLAPVAEGEGPVDDSISIDGPAPAGSSETSLSVAGGHPTASSASKSVADRAEAYRALGEIADFLAKVEPHSPVPFILRRAVNWKDKDFNEVITDIIAKDKEALKRLRDALGIEEEK